MTKTYEAILQGDQIEWSEVRSPQTDTSQKSVTVMEEELNTSPGEALFAILNRLAATDVYKLYGDPLEWQREQREDRPLPGRE